MSEYRVITQDVGSMMSRDVVQGATDLAIQVNQLIKEGWAPIGGISSVEAGTGIYLLQAIGR